jgi:S-DNA-T family DNA segregation ATPase FtsK/SpoIIIE
VATKTSPSRRTSRARTTAKRPRRPAPKAPAKTPVRQILSPHARDAFGVFLVVLALVSVLGLWFDAAGPVGQFLSWSLRGLFGIAAVAFPIVGMYWGLVLLRDTAREDRVRMFIGFTVLTLGALGVLSLIGGRPGPRDGYEAVAAAGGLLGAIVAHPLTIVISAIGAFIVCLGVVTVGLLIFTGTPISVAWSHLRDFFLAADVDEEPDDEPSIVEVPVAKRPRAARLREAFGLLELDDDDEEDDEILVLTEEEEIEAEGGDEPGDADARPVGTVDTDGGPYRLPPLDLFRTAPISGADARDEAEMRRALERTLQTFGVDARVSGAHRGPTVTMYEVEVASGTKVSKVLQLASDIAYALATPDVRIQAPIPGKSAIGIEVPNKQRDFVMLGDILRSRAAREASHPLEVALGKDVHGRARMVNLATMPHLLIAGATGAGKSSLVNSFVTSLLARTTPEDVRLVLVDPKRVELGHFADVPHLLSPVIVHPKRAAEALGWIVREMEQRYETLATVAVRDIDGYEEGLRAGTLRIPPGLDDGFGHMPFIVVVID